MTPESHLIDTKKNLSENVILRKNMKNEGFKTQTKDTESKEMTEGVAEYDDGTITGIEIEKRWRQLNNGKRKSKRKAFTTSIIRHKLKNKQKTVYAIKQTYEKRKDDAHIIILTKDDIMDLRGDLQRIAGKKSPELSTPQSQSTSKESVSNNTNGAKDIEERIDTENSGAETAQEEHAFADHQNQRYKSEMLNTYLQIIGRHVVDVRRQMCKGCLEGYPSQLDHYCLTTGMEQFLEHAFWNLLEKVDEEEANRMCDHKLQTHGKVYLSKTKLLQDREWVERLKMKILQSSVLNTCVKYSF